MAKATFIQYNKFCNGENIGRQAKKNLLGYKLNKRKLKELLSSVRFTDGGEIEPFTFCPYCGCREVRSIDHNVEWLEIWVEDLCLRCGKFVGGADNSVYRHILELEL